MCIWFYVQMLYIRKLNADAELHIRVHSGKQ